MRAAAGALVVAALCAPAAAVLAQSGAVFNRTGSGARAAGMANAFIAVSDDGTAASWNPAGLAQLRKPEFSIVSATVAQSMSGRGFRAFDDSRVFSPFSTSHRTNNVEFASLAVPVTLFKKPVTFQTAWQRLYTLDLRESLRTVGTSLADPAEPALDLVSDIDTTGGIDLLSFSTAVKLTPRLALGAGVNFWRGDWFEVDHRSLSLLDGTTPTEFGELEQKNRLRGHSVNLGLLLTYPRWSVGLQYQGELSGDFHVDNVLRTSAVPGVMHESADARADFPQAFAIGTAFRPGRFTIAFDLTWDDWTETTVTLQDREPRSIFDGLPKALSGTRDTLSAHAGAEYLVHGEGYVVPLRLGVAWEPQGPRNAYTREGAKYVMLAAGTGYNTNTLKFDAAVQYRRSNFLDGDEVGVLPRDEYFPAVIGERDVSEWRVKFSVILRLADTDGLRGRLKRMFGG